MEVRRVGERGLLVLCAGTAEVRATHAGLLRAELGAAEIVPAARTVLVDGLVDPVATTAWLAGWTPPAVLEDDQVPGSVLVEVPTRYDGPDLDEVARQWDLSTAEVIALHQGSEFVVVFCGFAPGFAYCSGLPAGREVRRRTEPRTSVPPGSVALAGEYTSVYPTASPGGWQLIGRTDLTLWDPARESPALLTPGTRVRFVTEESAGE